MTEKRILVIDDSPTLLKLVQLALAKAGFVPVTTGERTPATALQEEHPALVLLGSVSAAGETEAFFTALRARGPSALVPVVLLRFPEDQAQAAARPREVVDVVTRPFSPEALLVVVQHALKRKRDPDAPLPATDLGSLSLVPLDDEPTDATIETAAFSEGSALSGDLGIISLADVLGLLDAEGQTGTLSIRRADARLRIYFSAGRIDLTTAEGVAEEFLLGRFLVRGGALAAPTLAAALEARAREASPAGLPLLGRFLVERGFVGQPALKRVLALQTAALIFESLRWGAGRFGFDTGKVPGFASEAALGLAVPALLIEGFRRVDEWRLIEREVGDFDAIFIRDEGRVDGFGRARLTREEGSVLDLCDGRRTVREIIDRSQLGAFDTTKMLYRLARTRLVRRRVAPVAVPA